MTNEIITSNSNEIITSNSNEIITSNSNDITQQTTSPDSQALTGSNTFWRLLETVDQSKLKALSASSNLDYSVPSTIDSFGKDIHAMTGKNSNVLLDSLKTAEMDVIGERISSLIEETKKVDASNLVSTGFFSTLKSLVSNPVQNFIEKKKTVDAVITKIKAGLEGDRAWLLSENERLELAYQDNFTSLSVYDNTMLEGMSYLKNLEEVVLPELQARYTASNDERDLMLINELSLYSSRLEKRLSRIYAARAIVLRQGPQIRNMQSINSTHAETIDDLIHTALPVWIEQMSLFVSQLATAKTIKNETLVKDMINKTMQENAELMHKNSVDAAISSNGDIISIATIQSINEHLISGLKETKEINRKGSVDRRNNVQAITKMNEELALALSDI